jgi:hypothetical protein
MRFGNGGRPLPKQLTVVPIEAEEFELKRRKAAGTLAIDRDGRRHKDLIFPDDRRRKSLSGNFDLPFDVFGIAPFGRRRRVDRGSIPRWAAPMSPVFSRREGIERREDKCKACGRF